MRVPQYERRRFRIRGWMIAVVVILLVLLFSLRSLAGFYTDYLWFDSLGRSEVWRGVLGAKLALSIIFTGAFFLLMWVNLVIADRLAPAFRPAGPEEEFIERLMGIISEPRTVYEAFAHDIYQNGKVLAFKKYLYLGYAYRILLAGLVASLLAFVTPYFLALLR